MGSKGHDPFNLLLLIQVVEVYVAAALLTVVDHLFALHRHLVVDHEVVLLIVILVEDFDGDI